jgi:hypothetical protein
MQGCRGVRHLEDLTVVLCRPGRGADNKGVVVSSDSRTVELKSRARQAVYPECHVPNMEAMEVEERYWSFIFWICCNLFLLLCSVTADPAQRTSSSENSDGLVLARVSSREWRVNYVLLRKLKNECTVVPA